MRNCAICNTPIQGRSDMTVCGNACRIKRCRLRKALSEDFQDILYSLQSKDELLDVLSKLKADIEAPIPA